tara:strand:+ start:91 stop:495 length:405 start_codon:yes stop_codon:yes gene_type:complete
MLGAKVLTLCSLQLPLQAVAMVDGQGRAVAQETLAHLLLVVLVVVQVTIMLVTHKQGVLETRLQLAHHRVTQVEHREVVQKYMLVQAVVELVQQVVHLLMKVILGCKAGLAGQVQLIQLQVLLLHMQVVAVVVI